MGQADVLEVGRFSTMASGAGSVRTTGTCMKPRWCASNWAEGLPWQPQWRPTLGKEKASFCWMMWTVQEDRVFWDRVPMLTGTSISAVLEKTPVSSAQVAVTSPSKDARAIIQTASPLIHQQSLHFCAVSVEVCMCMCLCMCVCFGFLSYIFSFLPPFDLPLFCSVSWVFGLECHKTMCVDHLWPFIWAQSQETVVSWGIQLECRNFPTNRCRSGF